MSAPDEPTAREALGTVAAKYQAELEDVYRAMMLDALRLPAEQRPTWDHLQNREVVGVLGEVEGLAWGRALAAMWLDQCLIHGFAFTFDEPEAPEQPDGGDA